MKAQKNDERDAEAIAKAATRPMMRFVELKSEAQLDAQILHRARTRLVGQPVGVGEYEIQGLSLVGGAALLEERCVLGERQQRDTSST